MATRGGARGKARTRLRAGLEEEASSGEETRAVNAREIRVARRRRVRNRNDRDARLSVAWQQTSARRDASRTLSEEEEVVRQAEAALEIARTRVDDPAFFTSDEEDASRPVRMQSEPLTLEAEEEMRRISQQRE